MPRNPVARFPSIAVDDELVKLRVDVTRDLNTEIEDYTAYFTEHTGKKPRSQEAVVAGILADYLRHDAAFQKWRKQRATKA
uniref:DUF2274 domain-containing protein n=1 Tax=Sulfuriferula sp. GW6 TaxID=3345112 RepID=UPI0039F6C570